MNMHVRLLFLGAATLCAACVGEPSVAPQSHGQSGPTLAGATIGPDGYATILDAPPAPFAPQRPSAPQPLTTEQLAGDEQFRRAGQFQSEVMDEVQALAERLRSAERGNFVDLYFENEGEPHVVFRFLRDAQTTLARYTKHPRFRAATARYSNEQLQAAADFMLETFREDRVIQSLGRGNKRNRVEVEIAVSEPEFRALLARKGVTLPEAVELSFQTSEPASAINRSLPPHIARLVRIFPRSDRPAGILHSINSRLKVILDDGCFRVSGGDHDGALVLFPIGAELFIDRDSYLAYGSDEAPQYARVGEELLFPGSIGEVTTPELVAPIRAACGPGTVVKISAMTSAFAADRQRAVDDEVNALQGLRESYGLTTEQAQRALEFLSRRQARQPRQATPEGDPYPPVPPSLIVSAPPPPVMDASSCPSGTTLSYGLCRTPEGHIRPLPEWLQEFLKQDE